jgi:hypothetical protein
MEAFLILANHGPVSSYAEAQPFKPCPSPKLCASAESMIWKCTCHARFRYDSLIFVCLRYLLGWVVSVFRSREELLLENLALRQQLLALHSKRPRPRPSFVDRLFWVILREFWTNWKRSLILVTPETVVCWHRAGFLLYWSWISRTRRSDRSLWRKRALYPMFAFFLSSASVTPFLEGHALHAYTEPYARILTYLSMALLPVFTCCSALWWIAWRSLCDLDSSITIYCSAPHFMSQ